MEYVGIFVTSQYTGKVRVWNPSAAYYMQNDNAPKTAKVNFLKQIQRLKEERTREEKYLAEYADWKKSKENPFRGWSRSEMDRDVERMKGVGPYPWVG